MIRLFLIGLLVACALPVFAQTQQTPTWTVNQAACAKVVTPSDTAPLPAGTAPCANSPKALFVAGTGAGAACVLVMSLTGDHAQITYANVQPGAFLPVRPYQIFATNTTCVGMVVLY